MKTPDSTLNIIGTLDNTPNDIEVFRRLHWFRFLYGHRPEELRNFCLWDCCKKNYKARESERLEGLNKTFGYIVYEDNKKNTLNQPVSNPSPTKKSDEKDDGLASV